MKHMSLKRASVLMLAVALFVVACSKGDTGPAGEKGPQGDKGDTGNTGAAGKTGTANVIYSDWFDATLTLVDSGFAEADIAAPKLVDSIVQKGDVKAFWNLGTAAKPLIMPLPYEDHGMYLGVADFSIKIAFAPGYVILLSNYGVGSGTTQTGEKAGQFRYVLIPGGVKARSAVNWNDYTQVKNYLGLKD